MRNTKRFCHRDIRELAHLLDHQDPVEHTYAHVINYQQFHAQQQPEKK
jgi:hypothetical protein